MVAIVFPGHDVVGQQIDANVAIGRQHDGAFDCVLQFANIARPGVTHQRPQRLGGDAANRTLVLFGVFLEKMLH